MEEKKESMNDSSQYECEPVLPIRSNIEVDSQMYYRSSDDEDQDDGTGSGSGCVSLSSSVVDYPYEHGRRYHRYAQGQYFMPNDETEQDRLDMHHQIYLRLMDGKLTFAPLDRYPPKRILDVGTGTGIWALDIAEAFPNAEVIGTDLSPIQPNLVLENCRFEIDDAELEWTYPPNHFDFIHSRCLGHSIRDWDHYLSQIYKHLKPGGFIEIVEHEKDVACDDGSYPENCALREYMRNLNLALDVMGLSTMPKRGKEYIKRAGFIDIREEFRHMPSGPWPKDPKMKEVGYWVLVNTETSFEAHGLALFTRVLGMDGEVARDLCARAHRDCNNKRIHVYITNSFFVARKPLNG